MPSNENNYRIKLEFAAFLRGLPGFRVTDSGLAGFVNVAIEQTQIQNPYNQHYIINKLFKELEKDHADRDELIRAGVIFKRYLQLLKKVEIDNTYYMVTPGMMLGFFAVLHLCLLFFPANKTLVYGCLMADLYGLGLWLFGISSFSKHKEVLYGLESKLMEKIRSLKSPPPPPPPYEDVLLEDAMRNVERPTTPVMTASSSMPNFFHLPALNSEYLNSDDSDNDPRQEMCYSV